MRLLFQDKEKGKRTHDMACDSLPMIYSLDTRRAIVTSLYFTIGQFWKQRKLPVSRQYIKQSIRAIREIYAQEK